MFFPGFLRVISSISTRISSRIYAEFLQEPFPRLLPDILGDFSPETLKKSLKVPSGMFFMVFWENCPTTSVELLPRISLKKFCGFILKFLTRFLSKFLSFFFSNSSSRSSRLVGGVYRKEQDEISEDLRMQGQKDDLRGFYGKAIRIAEKMLHMGEFREGFREFQERFRESQGVSKRLEGVSWGLQKDSGAF